jgi:hypothetical protein
MRAPISKKADELLQNAANAENLVAAIRVAKENPSDLSEVRMDGKQFILTLTRSANPKVSATARADHD